MDSDVDGERDQVVHDDREHHSRYEPEPSGQVRNGRQCEFRQLRAEYEHRDQARGRGHEVPGGISGQEWSEQTSGAELKRGHALERRHRDEHAGKEQEGNAGTHDQSTSVSVV